jgi:hypothetical protein
MAVFRLDNVRMNVLGCWEKKSKKVILMIVIEIKPHRWGWKVFYLLPYGSIQTVEQAAAQCPCTFKEGQKLVVEFDSMEPNNFDAKNGVIIRAVSALPLE